MPGVSKEQIRRAKEIDLLSYLQIHEPHELIRSGPNEYRTATHHSLVISNGLWHWINGNIGGKTALDYLIHVRGFGFVEAIETLCGIRAMPSFSSQPVKKQTLSEKTVFVLPPRNGNNDRVIAYLQSRGIDCEIIDACIASGDLYESAKTHNCVFVGRDTSGTHKFAFMRGTLGNFKQDVAGSDKHYGFCFSPCSASRVVAVHESPVDALSAATLMKMGGRAWNRCHYLSLGGTSPLALSEFMKGHPDVNRIFLLLDNDKAGRDRTRRIEETLRDCSVHIIDKPPNNAKDYNEQLQCFLTEQISISAQMRQKQAGISDIEGR